jgi:hypothetical protein
MRMDDEQRTSFSPPFASWSDAPPALVELVAAVIAVGVFSGETDMWKDENKTDLDSFR